MLYIIQNNRWSQNNFLIFTHCSFLQNHDMITQVTYISSFMMSTSVCLFEPRTLCLTRGWLSLESWLAFV